MHYKSGSVYVYVCVIGYVWSLSELSLDAHQYDVAYVCVCVCVWANDLTVVI